MKKMYVIQWKSMVNGRCGKGSKAFDYDTAANLVEELNRDYPEIQHEMVPAGSHSDAAPVKFEREFEEEEALELAGAR